jgi:uncharacterized membrane protein
LLFASPTIGLLDLNSSSEQFSELYILGSNHTLESIPFNITGNVTYTAYLGISNHMGSSIYYTCLIKLRNTSESLPNIALGAPSSLPPLYEFKMFLKDRQIMETPFTFRVSRLTFSNNQSQLENISINYQDFEVNKTSNWNENSSGYYYDLVIELWAYNSTMNNMHYDNRFVQIYLNVTENI